MGTPANARTNESGHRFARGILDGLKIEIGYKESVSYNSETGTYKHKVNGQSDIPHTRRCVFEWDILLNSLLIHWS